MSTNRSPRSASGAPPEPIDGRYDLAGWYLMGRIFRLKRSLPHARPRLLDLGMGRGRDLLYFARRGFRAIGVDSSPESVSRALRRAARLGVAIETRVRDLRTYQPPGTFDVVYSSCFLNYLPARDRSRRLAALRAATAPGGIHALNAFVEIPSDSGSSGPDPRLAPVRREEIQGYYSRWTVLENGVVPFRCLRTGTEHTHRVEVLIARKPSRRSPLGRP